MYGCDHIIVGSHIPEATAVSAITETFKVLDQPSNYLLAEKESQLDVVL